MTEPKVPTWTILVATIGRRRKSFQRLVDILRPQLDGADGQVELLAYRNNGERPLGEIRQALVEAATGTYVSFIDDDDTVPYYFVDEVLDSILTFWNYHYMADPDYVGWQMQCYVDGNALKPTFHSLRYDKWWDDEAGYYRDISHLNPIRRTLALQADFRRTDPPEDVAWADQLRALGIVSTGTYIDRIMYHYHSSTTDSTWRPGSVNSDNGEWAVELPDPFMRYHPESVL